MLEEEFGPGQGIEVTPESIWRVAEEIHLWKIRRPEAQVRPNI